MRVLIVDDQVAFLNLASSSLASAGIAVDTAASSEDAVWKLAANDYDAIVCDVRMPGPRGTELYAWIEANRPQMGPRVLFASGESDSAAEAIAARAGLRFLHKPFSMKTLVAEVLATAADTGAVVGGR